MPALLDRRQLVLEVHAGRAGRDHQLHQLVGVEHASEARFGIRDERHVPLDRVVAVHMMDLVGAPERILNPADQVRHAVGGIQTLIGIHRHRAVCIRRDLPAADVNRLEAGLHFLHRLVARDRREHRDVVFLAHQFPEPRGAMTRECVLDRQRPAQAVHVFRRVGAGDPLPASLVAPPQIERRNEILLADAGFGFAVTRGIHRPPG